MSFLLFLFRLFFALFLSFLLIFRRLININKSLWLIYLFSFSVCVCGYVKGVALIKQFFFIYHHLTWKSFSNKAFLLLLISRFIFSLLLHRSKFFYRAWWRSLECPCVPLKCVFPTKICKNSFFSEKTVFLSSRCEKSSKFSVKNASLDKKL